MTSNDLLASEWTRRIMKTKIRSFVSLAGVLAGILAMGMATSARAGSLEIQLSTDGVHWTTVATEPSGTVASYTNANFDGFSISVLSDDSNSPGTPTLTYLEGSTVHVTNNNAGKATLYITLGDTGFTTPTNPAVITLDSQIGGSVTTGGKDNLLTYQSYVDPTNGQNSTTGFSPGPQTPNITGSPKSYNDDASMTITSGLTSTYSITESFAITLDSKSQVGFQSSTDLSAVPEPSSLVLSCVSVLGLVGYSWRRRASIARGRRGAGRTDVRK
jgi:PEP-CTERM motif